MTTDPYTYQRAVGRSYNRAQGDPRPPTAYYVLSGDTELGKVWSLSTQSWAKAGRIRVRMLGYARYWGATTPDGREVTRLAYTRRAAADALREAMA